MSERTGEMAMTESIAIPIFRFDGLIALVTLLFIAGLAVLTIQQLQAPAAVPATAPPTEFSSGRALTYVKAIAQQPHPIGAGTHAEVRDYLLKQLSDLGLQTEVQHGFALNADRAPYAAGSVQNVLGRLPGTASTKAVLLIASYDSVMSGPGASDNASGDAAILETLRAVKAGPPLRNDIIVLFSDGEEVGQLGAKAFIEDHPWARDVGLVLNLTARGTSGPAIMFETSDGNSRLIREFAQAAPYPIASSLFHEFYRRLPNDTDFTEFKLAGMSGMNIAFTNGFLLYHTALDTLENVDERSLQHHGSYALALTRHFGDLDLAGLNTRGNNEVYFNTFGSGFVHYSNAWIIPFTTIVVVVFICVAAIGLRKKQLTLAGIILGMLAFLATLAIVFGVVTLLLLLINILHPEYRSIPHGEPYNSFVYMLGFIGIALAIMSALYTLFRRKISDSNLAFGALAAWLIMLLASSALLPGGSYLFTWPLLFSLIGMGIIFNARQQRDLFTRHFLVLLLFAVPAIGLFAPLIDLAFISLTLSNAAIVAAMIVLVFGLLIPHLRLMAMPNRWLLPGAAALIGIGLLVAGNWTSRFDANHPKPNDIMYALDASTGKAMLVSAELNQDAWTSQFFVNGSTSARLPDFFPISPRPLRQTPALVLPLGTPEVKLIDDTVSNNLRTVRLHVTAPQDVHLVLIWVDPNTEVVGSLVNGKRSDNNRPGRAGSSWGMMYWAPPPEGFDLTLEVKPGQQLRVQAVDRIAKFPEIPGMSITPRPKEMIPPPSINTVSEYSDAMLVHKSFVFDAKGVTSRAP